MFKDKLNVGVPCIHRDHFIPIKSFFSPFICIYNSLDDQSHEIALEVRAHNVILTLSHSRGTLHWKFNRPKKPITIGPSTDFHGSNSSGLRHTSTLSVTHSLRSGPSDGLHDGVHVEVTQAGGGRTNTHCFISHLHMHLHE